MNTVELTLTFILMMSVHCTLTNHILTALDDDDWVYEFYIIRFVTELQLVTQTLRRTAATNILLQHVRSNLIANWLLFLNLNSGVNII